GFAGKIGENDTFLGKFTMLRLSRDDIRQVLDATELFEALVEGFRMLHDGRWHVPLRTAVGMPGRDGVALFMAACCESLGAAGIKMVTVVNSNPQRNLPLIHSEYLYASAETGEILAIIDAEYLTGIRTAVTSALVTDLLERSGGEVL